MASHVMTAYGKQELIGILRPGNDNAKYAGATAAGTVIYTYSDLPGMGIEWKFCDTTTGNNYSCSGTCAMNCNGCYAFGMVSRGCNYNAIALSAARHTDLARNNPDALYDGITRRVSRMRSGDIVRLYAMGDILNQEIADMWAEIANKYQHVSYYGYTKKAAMINLAGMQSAGINLVTGIVKGLDCKNRFNFGPEAEMRVLAEATGAWLCPCDLKENHAHRHDICMRTCKACLHRSDILFAIH